MTSVTPGTAFHQVSVAKTSTLNAKLIDWSVASPVRPNSVPGAWDSPGARINRRSYVPAMISTGPPTPGCTTVFVRSGIVRNAACINRHNGGVNTLFMDWSVRKVGLKELWTLKWHRSYDTAGPWTLDGGVKPSDWPEWMRKFKDY